MRIFKIITAVLSASVILSSCNLYKPTAITTPHFKEKGEFNLGVAAGSSYDANISYSVTDNIAVMASAGDAYTTEVTIGSTTVQPDQIYELKNYKYEGAVGYYDNIVDGLDYNVFAGYAAGKMGRLLDDGLFSIINQGVNVNFQSQFLQSTLHWSATDETILGLSLRLNRVDYTKIGVVQDPFSNNNIVIDFPNKTQFIGQTAFNINVETSIGLITSQFQYAFGENDVSPTDIRNFGFSLGYTFYMHEIFEGLFKK